MRLTEAQQSALAALATVGAPWLGLRPGSNFASLVEYETGVGDVPAEVVDELVRLGMIAATPSKLCEPICGEAPDGHPIPDADHDLDLTPAGRTALARSNGGGDV